MVCLYLNEEIENVICLSVDSKEVVKLIMGDKESILVVSRYARVPVATDPLIPSPTWCILNGYMIYNMISSFSSATRL